MRLVPVSTKFLIGAEAMWAGRRYLPKEDGHMAALKVSLCVIDIRLRSLR